MKIVSSLSLLFIIANQVGSYGCFYFMGRLEGSFWEFFNPFITAPSDLILLLILGVVWIVSLCIRKNRLWTTVTLLSGIAVIALLFVLPAPGSLVVYGIRNRVMEQFSIDDLRHFARDVHEKRPNIDITENDPSIKEQGADYDKLEQQYSFMKWGIGGKGNPYIIDRDGLLTVEWGGALPGHWGFSVRMDGGKNSPDPEPLTHVLRASEDIYFYHGE